MGESQQVQSLDAATTNVIFLPSKLLTPAKLSWKCLKERGGFVLLLFSQKKQRKRKKSVHLLRRSWGNFKNNPICGVSHLSVLAGKWEENYYL